MDQLNQTSTLSWTETENTTVSGMLKIWSHVQTAFDQARFEWNLVAFAVGIAIYFWFSFEPSAAFAFSGLCFSIIVFLICRFYWQWAFILMPGSFALLGIALGVLHTQSVARPILPEYHKSYLVEGWIEKTATSKSMQQIYVRVDQIADLAPSKTPKRVRIRLKPGDFKAGDTVQVRAVLNQPPDPAIAGGYDPARRAFFEQIGGYGFAVGVPEVIDFHPRSVVNILRVRLVKFRYAMSQHIQARAPPRTSGLQAALLTGDRSAIPEEQERYLRDAGLAHLLAISGMHMGLLAGGAYYLATLFFAMIGPWARRYDMRKCAAVIGMLFATGYLLLSGASVSTQRAYIMAMIVFTAIILDRRAVSMRSVAVAAAITLLLHPENLLNAGFQMSFSATAALVAVYRYWADRSDRYNEGYRSNTILNRLWKGFVGLSMTSFVAGTATAGFAALQFHRVARYGFVGNLAAMPMFTFLAMPAGFLAVLVIPIGLDVYLLKIMGLGLDYILNVSKWVSEREGALLYLKGANSAVIGVFGLGFVFLCLGPKFIRLLGIGLTVISIAMWANLTKPDMRISQEGRVALWDESGNVLLVDRTRGDGFGRTQFLERSGFPTAPMAKFTSSTVPCDAVGCRFNIEGKSIAVLYEPEGVLESCLDSDLVVLIQRRLGPVAKWVCDVPVVDTRALVAHGALDVAIENGEIIMSVANPNKRKARPWGG
ncbi:MAG: DUF4131 domain-containing protein [Hyphomonadaceae bacterium]|nr:DUF4131 domain-containing protein [Hyphomonadaceae bacterium]